MAIQNIVGQKFGTVTVMQLIGERGRWLCRCDCGNELQASSSWLSRIKSCGCERAPATIARNFRHGAHGTPEYKCWQGMLKRCFNPADRNYHLYGGRGITVCAEWRTDFPAFFAHVGQKPTSKHTIDRKNSDGNYEPGNVRWATRKEQARNRRGLTEVEFRGQRMLLIEACEATGQDYDRLIGRLARGWDLERALTTPAMRRFFGRKTR